MFGWSRVSKAENTLREAIEQSHMGMMLDQVALAAAVGDTAADYFRNQRTFQFPGLSMGNHR
jgi:hypothetical protein